MEDNIRKLFNLVAWIVPLILLVLIVLPQAIRILREYERGVIFRLGKLLGVKGPGLIFLIPIVDRMVKMDLRVVTIDVSRQEVMTRDNVPATVDAVVYCRQQYLSFDSGLRPQAGLGTSLGGFFQGFR